MGAGKSGLVCNVPFEEEIKPVLPPIDPFVPTDPVDTREPDCWWLVCYPVVVTCAVLATLLLCGGCGWYCIGPRGKHKGQPGPRRISYPYNVAGKEQGKKQLPEVELPCFHDGVPAPWHEPEYDRAPTPLVTLQTNPMFLPETKEAPPPPPWR